MQLVLNHCVLKLFNISFNDGWPLPAIRRYMGGFLGLIQTLWAPLPQLDAEHSTRRLTLSGLLRIWTKRIRPIPGESSNSTKLPSVSYIPRKRAQGCRDATFGTETDSKILYMLKMNFLRALIGAGCLVVMHNFGWFHGMRTKKRWMKLMPYFKKWVYSGLSCSFISLKIYLF